MKTKTFSLIKSSLVLIAMAGLTTMVVTPTAVSAQEDMAEEPTSKQQVDRQARMDYQKAREQYEAAVRFYREARRDYLTAKNNYLTTQSDEGVTLEAAKESLMATIDAMIAYLETIEAKIETIAGLSDSDREAALADIRADIEWLENHKLQIPNLQTSEQIQQHANEAQVYWFKVRIHVKQLVGQVSLFRIDWAIERGLDAVARLEQQISEWDEQGKDTTQALAELEELQENIDTTIENRDLAQDLYNQINGNSNSQDVAELNAELVEADRLLKESRQYILEANNYIKAEYWELRSIVKELSGEEN